ncbi:MAG: hypothetical protein B7Y45_02805 [Sphingomonas sp. 28-66-16]|nr:MAG: hypothetical protein B7Y45_02805 [Sphingomonas sp. 28-66-16]
MSLIIDARGMRCPWPAIRLARALREGNRLVEIRADDPAAASELAAVAAAVGARFDTIDDPADPRFRIESSPEINTSFT